MVLSTNTAQAAGDAAQGSMAGMSGIVIVVYLIIIGAFFYFVMIRPQKKEQAKMSAMLSKIAIGDSILTTSGFYGIIIDVDDEDDTIIVEFGNNKNCRVPMNKSAIAQVEKTS